MSKVIRATDDNALEQLKERLEKLQAHHEEMKKRNQYFRKNGTMVGYSDLDEKEARKIDAIINDGRSWEKCPHPAWEIQNSNQRIKATEQRIKQLAAEQNREQTVYDTEGLGFDIVENAEEKRLQIIYPGGRVDDETYKSLRRWGFVYSRTNQAFQRQINDKSRWAAQRFIEEQRSLQKTTAIPDESEAKVTERVSLREFTRADCIRTMYDEPQDGALNNADKVCIIPLSALAERYREPKYQLFRVKSGFGITPSLSGNACYGHFCADGEECRWEKSKFYGVANAEVEKIAERLESEWAGGAGAQKTKEYEPEM